jgi:hypothetical protein
VPVNGIRQQLQGSKLGNQLVQIAESQEEIDLRDLHLQFPFVSLNQAADCNHGLDSAILLEGGGPQHGFDRLLFGSIDEPTRVHENHVGSLEIAYDPCTVTDEVTNQSLRVDSRLVTTEGDYAQIQPATSCGVNELERETGSDRPVALPAARCSAFP